MKSVPTLLAAIAFTGCVQFEPQPLSPKTAAESFEQRSLAGEEFRLYAETNLHRAFPTWPPTAWDLETLTVASLYFDPDLAAARANYAVIESALQLEIARQYPDIHLSPGYEFDQGDSRWGLGLNIEQPVLSRNLGTIAEAEARRRESAFAGYHNTDKTYTAAKELWDHAQSREHVNQVPFKAGEVSPQAVAAAKLETAQADLVRLDALFRVQQAAATLESALQLPLDLPSPLLNNPRIRTNRP